LNDHFQPLKALLKCFNKKENYEFYENDEIIVYRPRVIVYCEEQDIMFRVYYDSF